jgi:O-antigen/teichoic acid export membrane protein
VLLTKLISFGKETLTDARQIISSRDGVKSLYQVSLYRNAVYLVIYSAVNSLTGILFWIAAARLYDTGSVGLASATITAIGFVVLFSALGLDYGLVRFLPGANVRTNDTINTCFTASGFAAVILAGVFLAGLGVWSPALLAIRENALFILSFIIIALIFTLSGFVTQVFIARRRAGFALTQGLVFGLSRFIPLVLLAPVISGLGIYVSWGIAVLVSTLLAVFWFLPWIIREYRPRFGIKKAVLADMFRFSLANFISNILWALPMVALPLMVVNILGAEQNAFYYVGWSVASTIFIIPAATSQSLFAEGSHSQEKLAHEVRKCLKISFVLIIPALIILLALGDKILWLFGRAYSENTTRLIWIITPSIFPLSINYIYLSIKRIEKKMKRAVILSAVIAVITLGLSCFLLPGMGILGAGLGWLAGQTGAALFVIYEFFFKRGGNIVSPEATTWGPGWN